MALIAAATANAITRSAGPLTCAPITSRRLVITTSEGTDDRYESEEQKIDPAPRRLQILRKMFLI